MSNDEYEHQKFWEPTIKELMHSMARQVIKMYQVPRFPLEFLTENTKTDNNTIYKWDIDNNYANKK